MKGVSKAMANMNRQMNMPQIQQILHEFEKQSEIMDMKEEMINDAIDDAMEDEGDEDESDAIVSQVLDELGLQLTDQLSGLPQVRTSRALRIVNHLTVKCFQASGSLSVSGIKQPKAAAAAVGGGGGGAAAAGGPVTTPTSDADDELQKRLDNLRRE